MSPAAALVIRPALPADAPVVFGFVRALARFEKMEDQVDVDGAVERLARHMAPPEPACDVLLAELAGRPVGFALVFPVYSTFKTERCLHLEDLFVEPAVRGQGIGEALLRRVAALAAERGCARLQWCVLDWNAAAIRFYERMGARLRPDWRFCMVEGHAAISKLAGSSA